MKEGEKRRWQNRRKKKNRKCLEGKSYETNRMFQERHWWKNPETALRPMELLMRQTATKELPQPWFSRGEKP